MKKLIILSLLISCVDMKPKEQPKGNAKQFTLPVPKLGKKIKAWATWYRLHEAKAENNGIALRDKDNKVLVKVSEKDFCLAGLQGSVKIGNSVYNFYSRNEDRKYYVDCSAHTKSPWPYTVRYSRVDSKFGKGVKNYNLAPFRSIAVDPKEIPYGTTVFAPKARGIKFIDSDGVERVHDGYFFAADTGRLILNDDNHIDVFRGSSPSEMLDFIKSDKGQKFDLYIVESYSLEWLHK